MQRMNGFTPARRRVLMILPVGILLAIGAATLVAYVHVRQLDAMVVQAHRVIEAADPSPGVLAELPRDEGRTLEDRLAGESARVRLMLLVIAGGLLLVGVAIVRADGLLAGYAAAQERALAHISEQNEALSAQRDALEESAAALARLNVDLLDRTHAAEEAHAEAEAQRRRVARLLESERRARAEAERANEAKVNFLSIMSHDVRTPLNAILGYAELMHAGYVGELAERQRDFVGRILASTTILRTLVEEVLEYARLEAGRLEIRPAALRVEPLLERVHTMVAPLAAAKRIALVSDAPPPVRVRGDEHRIGQILSNLATNAVKYTPEGGRVQVEAAADDACVEFRVADNGPGIAPADMERIFEPFVQLERARPNLPGGGVGLGLAISRQLAQAMGGELRADSRPGRTTFTLRLPRADKAA